MIKIEDLREMFQNIRNTTNWDIDGPMLWGYFFTDQSREKLTSIIEPLEHRGYQFVDLFIPDLDEDQPEYFFLHVEKIETHSVESLNARNHELESLANAYSVDSYDGMDVGPVPAA